MGLHLFKASSQPNTNLCFLESSHSDFSYTDTDSHSQSSSDSDQVPAAQKTQQRACRYYNSGYCRNGKRCPDLHVCKYFLRGFCRNDEACSLQHIQASDSSTGEKDRGRKRYVKRWTGRRDRSSSSESVEDSDRPYRWQLDLGNGWEDVANDYILEAQYSQPNTKGIKIYNTPCGALSIDFTRMRILKKTNLRVRRKNSSQTEWLWHYRGNHGWCKYGTKDSKGNVSSVSSSKLEREYQNNMKGTVSFVINSTTYKIMFKDMCQKNMNTGHRRRIRRRPKYVPPQGDMIRAIKNLSLSSSKKTVLWQYRGNSSHWHTFKKGHASSISSEDIEAKYKHNPNSHVRFTVNGDPYILDFSKMTQTNEKTNTTRKVQRVPQ